MLGVDTDRVVEKDVSVVGKRFGDLAVFWWCLPFFWEAGVVVFFFSFVLLACVIFWEYIVKQEVVVLQTPEWKFKANIFRNATVEGG